MIKLAVIKREKAPGLDCREKPGQSTEKARDSSKLWRINWRRGAALFLALNMQLALWAPAANIAERIEASKMNAIRA